MNPSKRRIEVPHHLAERCFERRPPANQHIIVAGMQICRRREPYEFPQAPPHAVTHHGIAHLPRHREAHSDATCVSALPCLHDEGTAGRPHRGGRSAKVRPALQPLHDTAKLGETMLGRGKAPVTHSAACVHGRAAPPEPCDRPWLPYEHESRGGVYAPICSAGRFVSRGCLRSRTPNLPAYAGLGARRCAICAAYTGPLLSRQSDRPATCRRCRGSVRFCRRGLRSVRRPSPFPYE
jgi:hypothetical protein